MSHVTKTGVFLFALALLAASTNAFAPTPTVSRRQTMSLLKAADAWSGAANSDTGSLEQIEFKIHPDGRVEETVRGIKGNDCHKVTEDLNAALGEVVASEPTEEMFEQEVSETLYNTESNDWESSSW